jgi:hypothetical protein
MPLKCRPIETERRAEGRQDYRGECSSAHVSASEVTSAVLFAIIKAVTG